MSDERQAPEYLPECAPETTGTRWIPIAEAEALLGKKERNARYCLDCHRIPARGERPKRWSERAILAALAAAGQTPGHEAGPPPEHAPEYPPAATGMPAGTFTGTPPRPIEAAYRVTPADVERAVERTAAQSKGRGARHGNR